VSSEIPDVKLPQHLHRLLLAAALAGGLTLLAGLVISPARIWPAVFVANHFMLELALAGIFFVAVQYVSVARWSVGIRRIPETMALLLPIGAIGLLAILQFHPQLYPWMGGGEQLQGFKKVWLNLTFFRARTMTYLASWLVFAFAIVRTSRRQDRDGSVLHTRRNVRLAAGFLVVLAVTLILASFDWLMSLEPRWYSTIFGFYDFASLFTGGIAVIILLALAVERLAPAQFVLTEEARHDLGKLLFAFCTFWGYIWFCQYMLIWYTNIPEEASYYVERLRGGWGTLFLLNLFLNWAIPFFALLPRRAKQSRRTLLRIALVVLAGRWLDLYLMIIPPLAGSRPVLGIWEVGVAIGALALFALLFFRTLGKAPLVPRRDPHYVESLQSAHEQI
jgi:hypothetical protein